MSLTLYYAAHTRATRVAFILEELGVDWKRVPLDLSRKENKTPEYLAIHPHGWVPALRDGETTVFETAAICLYLADRFPSKGLAPGLSSPERAAYYQWIVYSVATLEPAIADFYLQMQLPPGERNAALLAAGQERFKASAEVLQRALQHGYLVGEKFSAADVLVGHMLIWADSLGLLAGFDTLADYASRIRSRPAFSRI